jgi:hypothetical protein
MAEQDYTRRKTGRRSEEGVKAEKEMSQRELAWGDTTYQ